jgi:predicted dienelactone hydrolase
MQALADDGYLVVAPNHKDALGGGDKSEFAFRPEVGFGKPEDWTDDTYRDRAADIKAIFKALKDNPQWAGKIDWDEVALAGHSLGGYTVLGLAGGWPSWKPEGVKIKAVLALSPYCSPFIKKETLGQLDMPVMYQGGTRDFGITPFVRRAGGAFDSTAAPAYYIEFNDATHFAWTDLKADYQKSIDYYSLAFLNKHLKRRNVADITKRLPDVSDLRSK